MRKIQSLVDSHFIKMVYVMTGNFSGVQKSQNLNLQPFTLATVFNFAQSAFAMLFFLITALTRYSWFMMSLSLVV